MQDLIDSLPPLERLAASYAPVATRPLWIGYFALEQRLADAARDGRDAIMIQLRLAWWRDRLAEDATRWPKGEPLLAALGPWNAERAALSALVDGYEALHVGEEGAAPLDEARVGVMAALARVSHVSDGSRGAGRPRMARPGTARRFDPTPAARHAAAGRVARHGPARREWCAAWPVPARPAAGPDRPLILPNRYRFLYGMPRLQRKIT
jgi:phytoene synthase